ILGLEWLVAYTANFSMKTHAHKSDKGIWAPQPTGEFHPIDWRSLFYPSYKSVLSCDDSNTNMPAHYR
ncbi:hypothetical protein CRN59_15710, partial [Vibrio vulnificus]